jgi:hypothetical protein
MSHLEDLLCEYYQWQGYIVRRNIKVGRLDHGGWEGELDIVAYHPVTKRSDSPSGQAKDCNFQFSNE